MKCERCNKEHDGKFGSGRYCSRSCSNARKFTSESNRLKSAAAKRYYKSLSDEERKSMALERSKNIDYAKISKTWENKLLLSEFDKLTWSSMRLRVILEQKSKCYECGCSEWRGSELPLEIDHVNGNNKDNSRENLKALCPNCHSITPTWRGRNKKNTVKVSDDELLTALRCSDTIHQALNTVGLVAKGNNYLRAKRLLGIENK